MNETEGKNGPAARRFRRLFPAALALLPVCLLRGAEGLLRLFALPRPETRFYRKLIAALPAREAAGYAAFVEQHKAGFERTWEADFSGLVDWRCYRYDPELLTALKPGFDEVVENYTVPPATRRKARWRFKVNARGYRGPVLREFGGRADTVVMGDSCAFGWGVDEKEAFPSLLGKLFPAAGRPANVLSRAVPGYTSWQGKVLADRVKMLHPSLLIMGYGANDAIWGPERIDDLHVKVARAKSAPPTILRRLALYRALRRFLLPLVVRAPKKLVRQVEPGDYRENVLEILEKMESIGTCMVLYRLCAPEEYVMHLREYAESAPCAVYVDLQEMLETDDADPRKLGPEELKIYRRAEELYGVEELERRESLRSFFADGCHPNAWGHLRIAKILSEKIAELPAPPGFSAEDAGGRRRGLGRK